MLILDWFNIDLLSQFPGWGQYKSLAVFLLYVELL